MHTYPLPQTAIPFLIGTKYDTFATFPRDEQEEITKQVREIVTGIHDTASLNPESIGETLC